MDPVSLEPKEVREMLAKMGYNNVSENVLSDFIRDLALVAEEDWVNARGQEPLERRAPIAKGSVSASRDVKLFGERSVEAPLSYEPLVAGHEEDDAEFMRRIQSASMARPSTAPAGRPPLAPARTQDDLDHDRHRPPTASSRIVPARDLGPAPNSSSRLSGVGRPSGSTGPMGRKRPPNTSYEEGDEYGGEYDYSQRSSIRRPRTAPSGAGYASYEADDDQENRGFIKARPYTAVGFRHKSDPVAKFQRHQQHWSGDGFVQRLNRAVPSAKARITKQGDVPVVPPRKRHNMEALRPKYVAPTDKRRNQLRWQVREQMQYQDPTFKPKQHSLAPNTYVPPTSRRRNDLRWNIRQKMCS